MMWPWRRRCGVRYWTFIPGTYKTEDWRCNLWRGLFRGHEGPYTDGGRLWP